MHGTQPQDGREIAEERRRYRRYTSIRAVAEVDGGVWSIVDVSLGGFGARTTENLPRQGDPVFGQIVGSERDRPFRIAFEGRVVRVDPKNHFVGVQFGDMTDAAFDKLMHVLAVLEDEWRLGIERLDRQKRLEELRKYALRAVAVLVLALAATLALAWLP